MRKAPFFYDLLAAGTLGGTVLTLAAVDPISLLVLSATVNGVLAVPFLLLVMLVSEDRTLMGEHRNSWLARAIGWTTVAVMTVAAVTMILLLVLG